MSRVQIDTTADAAYLPLTDRPVARSRDHGAFVVDHDRAGRPVGIEVLSLRTPLTVAAILAAMPPGDEALETTIRTYINQIREAHPMTTCCGTSVGVIIRDAQDRLLMIERGWYPVGIAPVAGHVADAHADPESALVAEVAEEVGLTVTSHERVWAGWLPNLCASPPAHPVPGHQWTLATATVTGDLAPDPEETRGADWYSVESVCRLAERTMAYAKGRVTETEWQARPGLEPVWCELLMSAGVMPVFASERCLARRLYTTPPEHYWLGDTRGLVPAHELA